MSNTRTGTPTACWGTTTSVGILTVTLMVLGATLSTPTIDMTIVLLEPAGIVIRVRIQPIRSFLCPTYQRINAYSSNQILNSHLLYEREGGWDVGAVTAQI